MAENEKLRKDKDKFSEFDDVWNILPHFRFDFFSLQITDA